MLDANNCQYFDCESSSISVYPLVLEQCMCLARHVRDGKPNTMHPLDVHGTDLDKLLHPTPLVPRERKECPSSGVIHDMIKRSEGCSGLKEHWRC